MRICIVGAGVAGMTLVALLERRGVKSVLVERAADFEHAGYMLGLYPLGYRVLHGLGLFEAFREEAVEACFYDVFDGHGKKINHWSMEVITDRFGPVLSSTRPQLVSLLRSGLGDVDLRFNTTVESFTDIGHAVQVKLSDGTEAEFDLLVAADGIHSRTREEVFGKQPGYDTEWGGWVWWAKSDAMPAETFAECWGAGRFAGVYPTTRGLGVFAGAPDEKGFGDPGAGRGDRIRAHFDGAGELVEQLLADLPPDDEPMFFWRLADVRAQEWYRGRVVLLGDSAAGFLPTAGIGASMAMESAAVLNDELSRADASGVLNALKLFELRRRCRVEDIQSDSRGLARMMFVRSSSIAAIRDLAARFYTLEMLASDLAKSFETPI